MKSPLVSIIMPCYNGAKYLAKTLDCIAAQTYKNIELIFVNDGSTDDTEAIFSSYKQMFMSGGGGVKTRYIRQANGGLPNAINAGLKVFKGDYLSWLDSDDLFAPTFIEKHVEFLEANPDCGFCYADTRVIDEREGRDYIVRRKPTKAGIHPAIMQIMSGHDLFSPAAFCVARREAVLRAVPSRRIYDGDRFYGQNMQLLIPLAYFYNSGAINETLSTYVMRAASSSAHIRELHLEQYYRMLCWTIEGMEIPQGDKLYMASWVANNWSQNFIDGRLAAIGTAPQLRPPPRRGLRRLAVNVVCAFVPFKSVRHWIKK